VTTTATVQVTVRFFAAARAAAGNEVVTIRIQRATTVGELVDQLSRRDTNLAKVLMRCSYLRDGIAVRDLGTTLSDGQTVDVLPPFAGG